MSFWPKKNLEALNILYTFSLGASKQSSLLAISLIGVEFREGGHQWLSGHLMSADVKITPFQVTKKHTLDCMVYKKKVDMLPAPSVVTKLVITPWCILC